MPATAFRARMHRALDRMIDHVRVGDIRRMVGRVKDDRRTWNPRAEGQDVVMSGSKSANYVHTRNPRLQAKLAALAVEEKAFNKYKQDPSAENAAELERARAARQALRGRDARATMAAAFDRSAIGDAGVEAYGVKGLRNVPWRKVFRNQAEFERWLDQNEGEVEVYGTREAEPGARDAALPTEGGRWSAQKKLNELSDFGLTGKTVTLSDGTKFTKVTKAGSGAYMGLDPQGKLRTFSAGAVAGVDQRGGRDSRARDITVAQLAQKIWQEKQTRTATTPKPQPQYAYNRHGERVRVTTPEDEERVARRKIIAALDRAARDQVREAIRPGDIVTISTPQGQTRSGKAVMKGPHGWVLNMGGRHGTPAVATEQNIVHVRAVGRDVSVTGHQEYEFTHGRKPKGSGAWAFEIGGKTVFLNGSFTEAVKQAKVIAKASGAPTVKVLT